VRVLGIDPGYGCVESDGRRHRMVICGTIQTSATGPFSDRLASIHGELAALIRDCAPDCVAIENLFHATNVRSALLLGHARGVAMLAAVQAGLSIAEYTPAEIKRAVVGYGRAEKPQVQRMIKLLLGMERAPASHDAADALAVAICHIHSGGAGKKGQALFARAPLSSKGTVPFCLEPGRPTSWRSYRPGRRLSRA